METVTTEQMELLAGACRIFANILDEDIAYDLVEMVKEWTEAYEDFEKSLSDGTVEEVEF